MIVASALSGAMDAGQASDQGCDGGVFWVFPKADQVCLLFASSLSLPLPLFFLRMYGHVQVSDVWSCTGVDECAISHFDVDGCVASTHTKQHARR